MSETARQPLEVHDPDILAQARGVLNACESGQEMQDAVIAAVKRNERWRGEQCLNLLAPEAPTSPPVRALLDTGKDSSQKLMDVSYRRTVGPCAPSQATATTRAWSTHRTFHRQHERRGVD